MAKIYSMQFGIGDPRTYTGLAPTFLSFINLSTGVTNVPPSISEALTGSGIYKFTYGTTQPIAFLADAATTSPGTSARYVTGQLDPADRADEYGTTMIAIGTSLMAYGSTLVGFGTSGFAQGSTLFGIGTSNIALGNTGVAYLSALTTSITSQGSTLVGIGTSLGALGISLTNMGSLIGTTASSFGSTSIDPTTLFGFLMRAQEMSEGNQTYTKATNLLDFYNRGSSTLLREKTVIDSSTSTTKT